jgi:Putative adhesin
MRSAMWPSIAVLLLLAGTAASASSDTTFDRQLPAQPRGAVDISNISGTIEVSGWERADVSVHAELGSGVERVEVGSEGGRTTIKVVLPHTSGHGGEARLQVKIPKDSELNVSAVSADVTTSGVLGMQRLNAVSGDITAELAGADVEVKTVSGNLRLKGHGQPARLRLSTVSGDVRLEHGAGDFEASSVNGTLMVSLDGARSVRARTTSGDLRFEGSLAHGATLEASTVSGNLTVRASADGGYAYEVSSFSGAINDCFKAGAERASKSGPGSRLEGTRGEGAGHIRLKTMSGDVQLCDHP